MPEAPIFEAFMRKYQDMVYSTAIRLLANPTEAQDISQEVFLRAYEHYDKLDGNPAAGGWLKRVATNLCLNHLSRYRSRWSLFSDLAAGAEADEPEQPEFASTSDLASELESSDRHQLLEQALQGMPAARRVPLVLFHLEGLSYEEIATRLGVSLGKVKTDIFRARKELFKLLQPAFADEGFERPRLKPAC